MLRSRFCCWTGAAQSQFDGADCCVGSRRHPELPIDPAEAIPNGGGADMKLSADLPIGVPRNEQAQDLGFARRELNLVMRPCR